MMSVPVETGNGFSAGTPVPLFNTGDVGADMAFNSTRPQYDVSPDGRRFVMARIVGDSDKVSPTITVVENWYSEFKDR